MRNRAKCKLCKSIIESFSPLDYVSCKCGEIGIEGGNMQFKAVAKDFKNFLRVDDEGNEIVVTVKEADDVKPLYTEDKKPTRDDLLVMLDDIINNIERLPPVAMSTPITHYDHYSALLLLSSILRATD